MLIIFKFYLFHGLALFAISFAILFRKLQISRIAIAKVLPFLALFCLLRGFHEWFELYTVMYAQQAEPQRWLETIHTIELCASMLALTLFCWHMLPLTRWHLMRRLRQGVLALTAVFFIGAAYHYNALEYFAYLNQVTLHMQWIFGLVCGVLSGIAIIRYGATISRQGYSKALPFTLMGLAVVLYSLSIGGLNTAWGSSIIALRCGFAVVLAVATWSVLRVFDEEHSQLIEEALALSLQNQKLRELGELTSAIAHEIKTPLSSALMSCDILSHQLHLQADEQQRQTSERQLDRIRLGLSRAAEISQEVLNYAHQSNLKRDTVILSDVIRSALSLNQFRLSDFTVETDLDAELTIDGDAGLIEQVLTNIIGNAIDASTNTSDKRISIHSFQAKKNAVIQIADYAGGVSNAILDKMMTPFFTTKAVGEGTGMGLAICKKIVLQHGGEIVINNNPHGLTVEVQLPRKRS